MFKKTNNCNLEESETEDSYESQKSKCGNKDTYASICQTFLEKSPNSANLDNLCDDRYILKVKGGGRKETEEFKVKKFISKTGEINVVLNLL